MSAPSSIQPLYSSAQLPPPPESKVRAGLLTETFARTREGAPLGVLPIALIAGAHVDAIEPLRITAWVCLIFLLGTLHWLLAISFMRRNPTADTELSRWCRLEVVVTLALGAGWASAVWLLDSGGMDGLLYFKIVVLIAVAGFMLGTQGMLPRVYGCFLGAFVVPLIAFFETVPAHDARQATMLQIGFVMFGIIMAMRSRVENRRVRQWIEARLGQEELVERLRARASLDSLTGAFSRAHMQHALRTNAAAQRRSHHPYSVLMLDVDHFKQINDRWGHAVGDEVLRRMTAAIKAELRDADVLGRWGGEEFIVLLPNTRLGDAGETAARLLGRLERLEFAQQPACRLHVTASIGVAQAGRNETTDALIGRADAALYRAKGDGRNRVSLAAPAMSMAAAAGQGGGS